MALGSFKKNAPDYIVNGNNKMLLGDYKGAILEFTKAVMVDPGLPHSFTSRAAAKMELHDYEGVISDCLQAMRLHFRAEIDSEKKMAMIGKTKTHHTNPVYAKLYSMIGTAKLLLGKREEAIIDLNSARLLGNNDAYDILKIYSKY
jgi:tetratricopeptide (TPR) repeat protein